MNDQITKKNLVDLTTAAIAVWFILDWLSFFVRIEILGG